MIETMPSSNDTPDGMQPSGFVGTPEAARLLSVTTGRIRQLLSEKKLKGFKVEGEQGWQIELASIERYREYQRRLAEAREVFGGNTDE